MESSDFSAIGQNSFIDAQNQANFSPADPQDQPIPELLINCSPVDPKDQPVPETYTDEERQRLAALASQNDMWLIPLGKAIDKDGNVIVKKPCCKGWAQVATNQPLKLLEEFKDEARRVGLVCRPNHIVVIDCDIKDSKERGNGVKQFLAYCKKHNIPVSPVYQTTPSGGIHFFYRYHLPEVIRSRTKITLDGIPTNIDIRSAGGKDGDGSYIVFDLPGRSGYELHGDWLQMPELPLQLVVDLKEKPHKKPEPLDPEELARLAQDGIPEHVIENVKNRIAEIAAAPEGERNTTVFTKSTLIFRWLMPYHQAWEAWQPRILEAAMKTGLSLHEAQTAISQGAKGGEASGLLSPERYMSRELQNGEPELPQKAFSPELWKLLGAIAEQANTTRVIALALLLAMVSQCLGYNVSIRVGNKVKQCSNLWMFIIARTGEGKTTCFDLVFKALLKIENEMVKERQRKEAEWEDWQQKSKEEKRQALENGKQPPKFPKAVGIIARDVTTEALYEVLDSGPRNITRYVDEMRGFFGSQKRYQANDIGSSNADSNLAMFDSKPISIWRKTKDNHNFQTYIERATLSIVGSVQPGIFGKIFKEEDFDQGWPQRFIYFRSPMPQPLIYPLKEPEYDIDVDNEIQRMTDKLWAAGSVERTTYIAPECEKYITPFTQCLAYGFIDKPLSKLYYFSKRHFWNFFRVMHCLAFLEWAVSGEEEVPTQINAEQAYRGVLLNRWLVTNMVITFLGRDKDGGEENFSGSLKKKIAKVVVEHAADIIAEDYKVPNAVFNEWLREAGFGSDAGKHFTTQLKELKIGRDQMRKEIGGESKSVRVKVFSEAALKECRKQIKTTPLIFERLDDLEIPDPIAFETGAIPDEPLVYEDDSDLDEPLTPADVPLTPVTTPAVTLAAAAVTSVQVSPSAPAPVRPPELTLDETDFSNPYNFTHLHLHTDMSFLDATLTVSQAISHAKKCNMTALAITDHGNVHNARKFYMAAKAADIKAIIGCEAYIKNDGLFPAPASGEKPEDSFHLTLLAENNEGWKNLLALQRHSFDNFYRSKPLISHDLLAAHSRGLIAMSACLGGEIPQAILQGHDPRPIVDWYQKTFGEDSFFFERMENGYPELAIVNPVLCELSQERGVPLVATSDVHYLTPADREAYLVNSIRSWRLDKLNETVAEYSKRVGDLHFKTAEEMRFAHWDRIDELKITREIANRCHVELPEPEKGKNFMPASEAIIGEDKVAAEVLEEKALAGLKARGLLDKTGYIDRLQHELEIITQKKFESYILMINDMVEEARRRNILIGPGRGSAAGSLVCYVLGITQLDPIKDGLLFERFINPDRTSLPDIDVDYDEQRRNEMFDYLAAKYGEDCVAAIGTIGTRKGKGAINDAVRNLQNDRPASMTKTDWTELGKKLSDCVPDECKKTITELEIDGAFSKYESPETSRILEIAAKLEGLSRQASKHACGYVVAPHSLATALPLRRTGKGSPIITQWDKDEIEAAGYVKLDALGSLTLTRIRKTLEKIEAAGKPKPSFATDDQKTFKLLQSGETTGIFQLTSDGMRGHIMDIRPESLDDLTVAIALFRPGPLNSGMVEYFLKRRKGKEEVSYFGLDEDLRPILAETSGVIVYQEQVMRIAQAVAGFTAAEADVLRAAMGKKKMDVMAEKKAMFIAGAMNNGVSEAKAEELFGMMAKFAEYGFNKSHAAAYSLVAYQTAYLKANYTLEFLGACCETTDDNLPPTGIRQECKRLGIDPRSLPADCDMTEFGKHPLEAYGAKSEDMPNMADVREGQKVTIRAYAEKVWEKTNTVGKKWASGKISDETWSLPFIAFSEVWKIAKIKKGKCYNLSGIIQKTKNKALRLFVEAIEELAPPPAPKLA